MLDDSVLSETEEQQLFTFAEKARLSQSDLNVEGAWERIPYAKIVSFTPFSDGIGLHRDAVTAKPQFFVTGDDWFTYNAVVNLAKAG